MKLNMKEFRGFADGTEASDERFHGVECDEQVASNVIMDSDEGTCYIDKCDENGFANKATDNTSDSSDTRRACNKNSKHEQSSTFQEHMFEANVGESSSESDWEEVEGLLINLC
jgi:hypothetical protein